MLNASDVLFEDDFNVPDSSQAEKWEVIGDSGWQIIGGEYGIRLSPGLSNSVPNDSYWDYDWKDIIFELELRGVSGTDKNILVKFQDLSHFIELHHSAGNIALAKAGEGQLAKISYPLTNGPIYKFKIHLQGDNIKVFINDSLVPAIDVNDTFGYQLTNWKIGLRVGTGGVRVSEVWFDNVKVTALGDLAIGPFELPFDYPGRGENDAEIFRNSLMDRVTAYFDHEYDKGKFVLYDGTTGDGTCKDSPAKECYDSHNGIDFSSQKGERVISVADGRVAYASERLIDIDSDSGEIEEGCKKHKSGFGCIVIIEHQDNLYTMYSHLKQVLVEEGNLVNDQRILGIMGNTGCGSCHKHLHFAVMSSDDPLATSIIQMSRKNWKSLINQLENQQKLDTRPYWKYNPFCSINLENGLSFEFKDPFGWDKEGAADPWQEDCGIESNYLWRY